MQHGKHTAAGRSAVALLVSALTAALFLSAPFFSASASPAPAVNNGEPSPLGSQAAETLMHLMTRALKDRRRVVYDWCSYDASQYFAFVGRKGRCIVTYRDDPCVSWILTVRVDPWTPNVFALTVEQAVRKYDAKKAHPINAIAYVPAADGKGNGYVVLGYDVCGNVSVPVIRKKPYPAELTCGKPVVSLFVPLGKPAIPRVVSGDNCTVVGSYAVACGFAYYLTGTGSCTFALVPVDDGRGASHGASRRVFQQTAFEVVFPGKVPGSVPEGFKGCFLLVHPIIRLAVKPVEYVVHDAYAVAETLPNSSGTGKAKAERKAADSASEQSRAARMLVTLSGGKVQIKVTLPHIRITTWCTARRCLQRLTGTFPVGNGTCTVETVMQQTAGNTPAHITGIRAAGCWVTNVH